MDKEKLKELKAQKCVIYCRVSTTKQLEGTSIDDQKAQSMEFAKKYGFEIEDIIAEDASAMTPQKRKGFNSLLEKLEKNNNIKIVVFAYIDRMSRNPVDAYSFLQLIEKKKLTAIFLHENLMLQSPVTADKKLLLDILLGVSNYKVNHEREVCRRGILAKAKTGFRPCKPPYGYRNSKKKDKALIIKDEGNFVHKAFELYSTDKYTLTELADELYTLGYRYKLQPSKIIPKQSLKSMLSNKFYTGKYDFKRSETEIEGKHEAIISEELFEKVQKCLGAPKTCKKYDLLYSKILKCGACGQMMVGDVKTKPNGLQYVYYRCMNSVCGSNTYTNENQIDIDIKNYLKEIRLHLIPKNLVQKVLKEELYFLTQELSGYKRDLSRKYHAKERIKNFILENKIEDDDYVNKEYNLIEQKYGNLKEKIEVTEKKIELITQRTNEVLSKRLYDFYVTVQKSDKRKILELITSNIKLKNKHTKVLFKSAFRKIRKR